MPGGIIRNAARASANARVRPSASFTSPINASAPFCTSGCSRAVLLPTTLTFSPFSSSFFVITEPICPVAPRTVYIFDSSTSFSLREPHHLQLEPNLAHAPAQSSVPRSHHRDLYPCSPREIDGLSISRVHMPRHPHSRVVRQHPFDAFRHLFGAVRAGHLPSVLRVANSDSSTVVDGYPGSPARRIYQRVEQGPVRHCVRPVLHRLSFAIRRSHR